ncbi:stage II sporulation protein M [Pseudogracilibacillus sp. SE30717A]|uniref:stage II sporulation protein M n=1 Tax=Pseudogracilibacillus sp. SE30717A TaxID=3098293 RepID=UPI00300E3F71
MVHFIKSLIKPTIIFSIGLFITIIIAYLISAKIGYDPEKLFDDLQIENKTDKDSSAFNISLALFNNNIQVPAQILFLAIIPVPFLYTIVLLSNGITIGMVFYIYQTIQLSTKKGDPLSAMILKGFLPHAVIELLGFIIATALAFRINQWIVKRIIHFFKKKKEDHHSFKQLVMYTAFVSFGIILPLIILAALIEGYVTPLLL